MNGVNIYCKICKELILNTAQLDQEKRMIVEISLKQDKNGITCDKCDVNQSPFEKITLKGNKWFLVDRREHNNETLYRLDTAKRLNNIVLEYREFEGQIQPFFKCFADQLPKRTFYIETIKEGKMFIVRLNENGQTIEEYKNSQITEYYEADAFGVMSTVFYLKNSQWGGEAEIYLGTEEIIEEFVDYEETGEEAKKDKVILDAEFWKGFRKRAKKDGKKSYWYSSLAYYKAKKNGISLVIKHLERNNIKLVNSITSKLLKKEANRT